MDRLSLIDQALHKVTTTGLANMYMQGASILNPKRAPFKVNAQMLAEHLAARLEQVPLLRKRLVQDPLLLGDVRLVDDPDFDIWNHITFAMLPPPGDMAALTRYLGRFSSEQLPMDRPLWRYEIVDGLKDGRLVLVQKLSHATMDGMVASRIMQCIYDTKPRRPSRYKPHDWSPEPDPTSLQLLGAALRENADRLAVKLPRVSMKLLGLGAESLASTVSERLKADDGAEKAGGEMPLKASRTSLTGQEISTKQRNIAYAVFDINQLKALQRAMQCTLNDVCLLMVSEALLTYFAGIGEKIDFDLIACMPLDMRQASEREFGNELSIAMINLHTTIPELDLRLGAIQAETTRAKDAARGDHGTDNPILAEVAALIPPLTLDILFRSLKTLKPWGKLPLPCDTVFSNVPGPREELYIAGMPVETPIPIIPQISPGALSIGGCSNGDHFSFGFHACGKVVREEDMHFFVDGLQSAFRRLSRKHATAEKKSTQKKRVARNPRKT